MPIWKQCEHDEPAGANGLCYKCIADGVKPKKKRRAAPKKRKVGRPAWKTEKQKKETERRYFERTKANRKKYAAEYYKGRSNVENGCFVVEHKGLFRSQANTRKDNGGWVTFSTAKIFSTRGWANLSVQKLGLGTVMELKSTRKETIANWKAQQVKAVA